MIAIKMQKTTSAVSESPQKNNLVRYLRVHKQQPGSRSDRSVFESPQNIPPAAELCKDRDKLKELSHIHIYKPKLLYFINASIKLVYVLVMRA